MRSIFGCFQSFCVSRLHLKKKIKRSEERSYQIIMGMMTLNLRTPYQIPAYRTYLSDCFYVIINLLLHSLLCFFFLLCLLLRVYFIPLVVVFCARMFNFYDFVDNSCSWRNSYSVRQCPAIEIMDYGLHSGSKGFQAIY